MKIKIVFLSLVLGAGMASALTPTLAPDLSRGSAPENNMKYAYYYQFADKSLAAAGFKTPIEMLTGSVRSITQRTMQSINLLIWNLISQPLPIPKEPYNRERHFGGWIVDGRQGNCLNTRGVVLVRDSSVPAGLDPANRCNVKIGAWYDPYGNAQYGSANQIQIDHFVPLKHVYISGGFQWDAKTKCLYSNYVGFRTHLIPVSSKENQKKSDATPYSYLPPNKSFTCAYLVNWLKVKKIWNLALIPPETQAIANAFRANNCDATQFNMTIDELYQQRKYINDNYHLCDNDISGTFRGVK